MPTDCVRVHLDISSIKKPESISRVYKSHLQIIVVEAMQLKFVHFFKTKDGMVEPTCELLSRWKKSGRRVDIMQLDNAGENVLLQNRANSATWQLGINFEFMARDTPQQNSLAEVGIFTLANRVRAMMHYVHVPMEFRYKLFRDCYATAAINDGLMIVELNRRNESQFEQFFGKNPKCSAHLRMWGEAGTIKLCQKMTPKLSDRGKTCMMIGYAHDHGGDTYRMWDKDTGRGWMRRMYFPDPRGSAAANLVISSGIDCGTEDSSARESGGIVGEIVKNGNEGSKAEVLEGEVIEQHATQFDRVENEPVVVPGGPMTTRYGHVSRRPTRLIEEVGAASLEFPAQELSDAELTFLAALTDLATQGDSELESEIACVATGLGSAGISDADADELGCVGAGLGGGFDHTLELKQAMRLSNQEHWMKAVNEEHERMHKHKVWKPVDRAEVPREAKVLTSTWAMKKKKSNSTFRACVNARGYKQIEGIHYNADTTVATVVNKMTIRIMFTLMVMANWYAEVVDVRGAFLHGEFEEGTKLYMEVPEGFERFYPIGCLLLLLQTIYGLKQAAFAFWVQLLKALHDMEFDRSKADPFFGTLDGQSRG